MPTEHTSWQVELRAAPAADKLEIAVHDVIGQSFWEDGVTSKDFLAALRSAPKAKDIELRINSVGGVVDEAKGMGNLLAERAANGVTITAYVDGIAASAASYLLTFAHRVVMPSNTFQMLHEARGGVRGTAKDVEDYAELLRRTSDQIAEGYAAASARRGKGKTKEDFLALFAKGDTYLDADEAIEWGLADEKLEPLQVAACLVDLGERAESAPEALKAAPYVGKQARPDNTTTSQGESRAAPEPTKPPITPPGPSAREDNAAGDAEENPMMKAINKALSLPEDAEETVAVAAVQKLCANARIGEELERLVGATGDAALGAVRALKSAKEQSDHLAAEVAKLKVTTARRDFEAELQRGRSERKLTPHEAKHYQEKFDAAIAAGEDAARVVDDLRGWLSVAAPKNVNPGAPAASGDVSLKWKGKSFAELAPIERHQLKSEDAELYALMRRDWETANG